MPQRKCYICHGTGKEQQIGEETCPICHGLCRDFNSDLWSEPCRTCGGKGRVTYCRTVTCRTCYGSGQVPY